MTAKNYTVHFLLVLGSARTGLIFTRSQEGTKPCGLTQTGQTKQGIRYHVLSYWILGGVTGWGEVNSGLGACKSSGGESCSVHFAVCFVNSSYQYYCCYCSLCIAVLLKCPYPDPAVFCLFLSILLPIPMRGGVIDRPRAPLLPATGQNQNN